MGSGSSKGRHVSGIVVIDKPTGQSSNRVLQQVKRLFNANKAGHTGSLDPLATGVLPICLGEATKLSAYLLDADKRYHVTCNLGVTTDSGDADGQVIAKTEVPAFSEQTLLKLLPKFIGRQQQVPPMFSALKYQGKPLYKLARQGIKVERKARWINIYDIQLLMMTEYSFTLSVYCSKGTYIRTLVEDISNALGCGGHVSMLRRVSVAGYSERQAVTMDKLLALAKQDVVALDLLLLPIADALPDWSSVTVSYEHVTALRHGQSVKMAHSFSSERVKLFSPDGRLIGLGDAFSQDVISPRRIFNV